MSLMMMKTNPITPPPELVQQWMTEAHDRRLPGGPDVRVIATQAAQWGADQELEACCLWMERNYNYPRAGHPLRIARRPKPPSLKEQALTVLDDCANCLDGAHENTIRRALEALDD
jgi:hypothetical protein